MTTSEIEQMFEKHEDESHHFDRVDKKRAWRADVHALILLDELFPNVESSDMISSAEHDQIWLAPSTEQLLEKLTEDHIIELRRCGVWWDSDYQGLSMFR